MEGGGGEKRSVCTLSRPSRVQSIPDRSLRRAWSVLQTRRAPLGAREYRSVPRYPRLPARLPWLVAPFPPTRTSTREGVAERSICRATERVIIAVAWEQHPRAVLVARRALYFLGRSHEPLPSVGVSTSSHRGKNVAGRLKNGGYTRRPSPPPSCTRTHYSARFWGAHFSEAGSLLLGGGGRGSLLAMPLRPTLMG